MRYNRNMDQKPSPAELEAMAREIREAADEYVREMEVLRMKRRRLFETWANILDEKKAEHIRQQIYGVS